MSMNPRRTVRSRLPRCCALILGVAALPACLTAAAAPGVAPGAIPPGKYVAYAADCESCHTAKKGKPYAGGDALESAYGKIYPPNITQDPDTGIGSWSKADFERALRLGIRKDGAYLYPAMPYTSYTKMSAADMDGLWNYIHSLPAVKGTVPKNTLPFPLTIREGMAVWQALYFKPGPFVATAGRDRQWNRGAYLVQALGHCGDCHTPRNLAQGPEQQHALAGAQIEGWFAPDISNDPLSKVAKWKTQDLAHYLQTGSTPGNVKTFGPMQEVVHDSLRYLSASDVLAIATYLKSQSNAVQPEQPDKVRLSPERLTAGRQAYEDNCSGCHQANGKGIRGSAPALAGNSAVAASEPYNVIMAMLEGFAPQGSWGAMGSFASLSDDQIADIANYVRTAWNNQGIANATPWSVGNWRKYAVAANSEPNALLCPSLPEDVMQPVFSAGPDAIRQAAGDSTRIHELVDRYRSARPQASTAQTIEALSTGYCRALAGQHLSQARMSAKIADFAQQVAISAGRRNAASNPIS